MRVLLAFLLLTGSVFAQQGKYKNGIPLVSLSDGISYKDSSLDAFSRLPVADPTTIFDSQFEYGLLPLVWQTNGANCIFTHLPNESAMQIGTTNNCTAVAQTYEYFRYQAGKAQQIFTTFAMGTAVDGVKRRVGYFDANDGFYVEQNGTNGINICKRSSVTGSIVTSSVAQASWNLDKLDGTTSSGITLDMSKAQILAVDMQFLGVGRVRVGFDIDGELVWAHEFLHANSVSGAYIRTGTLPIRIEQVDTSGLATTNTMKSICSTVISSGGREEGRGYIFSAHNESDTSAGASLTHLISIRPKGTFGTMTNRVNSIPLEFEILGGAQAIHYQVNYGATITNAVWTSANTNSTVEYCTNGVYSVNGINILSGFVPASQGQIRQTGAGALSSRYPLTLDLNGANPKTLSILVQGIGGTPNCRGSIQWRELR